MYRHRLLLLAVASLAVAERPARACGCFTPPSPNVPVVQAGERILFAVKNGVTTAHIQIKYQGQADDFGWLVPLPAIPTLELGADEVFDELVARTQPSYAPRQVFDTRCPQPVVAATSASAGCGADLSADLGAAHASDAGAMDPNNALVVQASLGPYDYAVLKADDKTEMLDWLAKNRYFVPGGTGDAVTPYIHPGGFFLALKLRAGETAGNLQPVVVHYSSDLPMIPIVLTSVGASPDMPIQVWVLGAARAIPRNYHHAALNEARLDWSTGGRNYNALVTAAVAEAPKKHAFVTEYAGSSTLMRGVIDRPGRFSDLASLRAIRDPSAYLKQLKAQGFLFQTNLYSILLKYIPLPPGLAQLGVRPDGWFSNFDYWIAFLKKIADGGSGSDGGTPWEIAFDPVKCTDEIEMRVVQPLLAAAQLFRDYPKLTRLYTTLSPEDMTDDPVFSFNPDLPDVPIAHGATLNYNCTRDATLKTDAGLVMEYLLGRLATLLPAMPAAARIEILRDAGPPQIVTDNGAAIAAAVEKNNADVLAAEGSRPGANANSGSLGKGGGCRVIPVGNGGLVLLVIAGLALARRRRRN